MAKKRKMKFGKPGNGSAEFGMVLEYIQDQVKVIAEQTSGIGGIKKVMDRTEKNIDNIEADIDAIKVAMKIMKTDMELTKNDIEAIKADMKVIKTDSEVIKYGLKKKIDIDEFATLERRVSTLENRF